MYFSTARFKQLQDLKIHETAEKCRIWDMAMMSSDTLLLANFGQCSMQLVNSMLGRVVSRVIIPTGPVRLCRLSDLLVAATCASNVQLIHINEKTITKGKLLDVNGDVWGISVYSSTSFVVSYNDSPWLEVISVDGTILHRFDQKKKTHNFKKPFHLTTSSDGLIYASDCATGTISELDRTLQLLQTFSSPLLKSPRGIISFGLGQLLVCSQGNNRVVLLNTDTGNMSILLDEKDGIRAPHSSTYCPEQRKLYVAAIHTSIIQVYQLA